MINSFGPHRLFVIRTNLGQARTVVVRIVSRPDEQLAAFDFFWRAVGPGRQQR
jgi:hypothetical protein